MDREFWKRKPLGELSKAEWEALCDRCGRCCLEKLENRITGEIFWTNVACRLLDLKTCRCSNYKNRLDSVPDCLPIEADEESSFRLLPRTCAYRILHEGGDLPPWHYLVTGDSQSVHQYGISVLDTAISPRGIKRLEKYIIPSLF